MKGLSKLTYKVNPIFLSTLQKVYIARAQVIIHNNNNSIYIIYIISTGF